MKRKWAKPRRKLGAAQAARDLAGEHVNAMLADLARRSPHRAGMPSRLPRAADRLAATEKFLKAQNNAVRLQASAEADALRTQNQQLRECIDHLLVDNDRYRRTLAARGPGTAGSR
ncbi:hypothetical protein [Paraburkholderia diazotrophica]|uniref:hypothetical protein n=1 Tax=Paraburkholderia diazotrophica TaxID=667676 RepID=UPI00317C5AE1